MNSYNTSSTAYRLIGKLAALRKSNTALLYGTMAQRWINKDVYIYERAFAGSVVLVAINKNDSSSVSIGGLFTSLPAGTYADFLGGLLGGLPITVKSGGGNNPVNDFVLPAHTVSVWTHAPVTPINARSRFGRTRCSPATRTGHTGRKLFRNEHGQVGNLLGHRSYLHFQPDRSDGALHSWRKLQCYGD